MRWLDLFANWSDVCAIRFLLYSAESAKGMFQPFAPDYPDWSTRLLTFSSLAVDLLRTDIFSIPQQLIPALIIGTNNKMGDFMR